MELKGKDLEAVKSHYELEQIRLKAELKHANHILRLIQFSAGQGSAQLVITRNGEQARKRGPKSVWGKFVLEQLAAKQRPLSYRELIDSAMKEKRYSKDEYPKVRASILNSTFRLRAVQGKIETVGRRGRKEKFIVLTEWLDTQGVLIAPHKAWLRKQVGGKVNSVDMTKVPAKRYAED